MGNSHRSLLAIASVLILLAAAQLACNFPGGEATPDTFATEAAERVSAQLTESGLSETPTDATLTPTAGTPTPEVTATEAGPSPTPGSAGCTDRATFVTDVTIPDDTVMGPGTDFTKTWRLRNEGTCTWTTDYKLVFAGMNVMGGPASQNLTEEVPPNGTTDVSVDLTAPATDGTHRGDWKLNNGAEDFGIGASADKPFFVQIIVGPTPIPPRTTIYNFAENYCDAEWIGSPPGGPGTILPCPGTDTDVEGYVIRTNSPKLEDGRNEDEPTLITHPQMVNNGIISGLFPPFLVEGTDLFVAEIGCMFDAAACDVTFQFNYREEGVGSIMPLDSWTETNDGNVRRVEVDLSSLDGKNVRFAFAILANGSASDDEAFWFNPHIER